jgi:phosphate-selective porin OprO/OprP
MCRITLHFLLVGLLCVVGILGSHRAIRADEKVKEASPKSEEILSEGKMEPSFLRIPFDSPGTSEKRYPFADLGGLIQLDTGWFSQSKENLKAVGRALDGTSFRTARLWGKGYLYPDIGFMIEMDFGGLAALNPGRPNFQNAYIDVEDLPYLGILRVGRWKQPFSLETATSIRFLEFIERASLFTFVPFRRTGVGFFDATPDERMTYAVSIFRPGDDRYGGWLTDEGSGMATAERLTGLLWYRRDGEELLHLGVAHTYNDAIRDQVRFNRFGEFAVNRTPPDEPNRTTPNQVDTGLIRARYYNVLGTELAWVHGPFSLQGEYMLNIVERFEKPTAYLQGWYVYASYFLTGEHRQYIRKLAAFDRIRPLRNFSLTRKEGFRGAGAWELTVRLSQLDLTDSRSDVEGGCLTALTLGVNWYLNPNAKMQFNYIYNVRTKPKQDLSDFDVVGLRASFDF